jgi:hypothetical protein
MSSGNSITIAHFLEGEAVYISDQYYRDVDANLIEIPRFGWIVKSILNEVATIEYQRKNIKLNMNLMIDTKYLLKER